MTFGLTELARRRERVQREAVAPNRVFETMTCVRLDDWTVRVWREEPTLTAAMAKAAGDDEVRAVARLHWSYGSIEAVIVNVGLLERIAAVEVLDQDRNGVLFYPDWR